MKMRKVILTLEVETEAPLSLLRKRFAYMGMEVGRVNSFGVGEGETYYVSVTQAQANVVEPGDKVVKGGVK